MRRHIHDHARTCQILWDNYPNVFGSGISTSCPAFSRLLWGRRGGLSNCTNRSYKRIGSGFKLARPPTRFHPSPEKMKHAIHFVTGLAVVGPWTLRVRFEDGTSQTINFEPILRGELYGPLRD